MFFFLFLFTAQHISHVHKTQNKHLGSNFHSWLWSSKIWKSISHL